MNTSYDSHQYDSQETRYGLRVTTRLSTGLSDLPHEITERLRAARQQAVGRRKRLHPVARLRAAAVRNSGDDRLSLWGWLACGTLAIAMVAGLVTINIVQNDRRAVELANLDAALLTDDLPPEAYTDPGFVQYLQSGANTTVSR